MTQRVKRKSRNGKPIGRPSEYHDEMIAEAVELIHAGYTDFEIARHFGVEKTTLYRWKLAHPAFRNAFTQAKDQQNQRVEASMLERALGYSFESEKIFMHEGVPIRVPVVEHVPPDPKSMALWLTNRSSDRWKDRQDVNVTGGLDITNKLGERELALAMIQVLRDADDAADEPATIDHQEDRPAMVQVEHTGSRRFG